MNNPQDSFFANSVLNVKSSGVDDQAIMDLTLPPGRSIAELLYDQEKTTSNQTTSQND